MHKNVDVRIFGHLSFHAHFFSTADNEPLIPADTPLLLTTSSALLQPSSKSASFGFNTIANQRYFDRSDVIKAYREQLDIQTPEFSLLSEEATVGGRFRPRSSGEVRTPVFVWRVITFFLGASSKTTQTPPMRHTRNDIASMSSAKSGSVCARRRSSNTSSTSSGNVSNSSGL